MPRKIVHNPDDVDKKTFIAALESARKAAGSTFQLSLQLQVHPRRIMYWLNGDGPTARRRREIYKVINQIGG